jgi:Arc/MetJ-type ribon-helix-helix transcriptional regulator
LAARQSRRDEAMNIELTPDQRAFVQKAIESGRISAEEEAVYEALALRGERERRRLEIVALVDEAEASLARGEGRTVTSRDATRAIADEIKQRLRRRIAAERSSSSR